MVRSTKNDKNAKFAPCNWSHNIRSAEQKKRLYFVDRTFNCSHQRHSFFFPLSIASIFDLTTASDMPNSFSSPKRGLTFLLILLVGLVGAPVVAIDCEAETYERETCMVPSCDQRDSPKEENLWVPNAICASGMNYQETERKKRKQCVNRYKKLFDPSIKEAIADESLCTVAVDLLLETVDVVNPFSKLKWVVLGTKKAEKFMKYLEEKIDGFATYADDKLQRIAKRLGNRAQRLYNKFKEEIELIIEFKDGLEDAQFGGDGPYTKALKEFCESKIQSQNIGGIEGNVGFICEDLISLTVGEIKKGAQEGYKELYEALIEDGEKQLKKLDELKKDYKEKSIKWLIENQPEEENKIRFVVDVVEGTMNFKDTQRPKLIKKCERDYMHIIESIQDVCNNICDPLTKENLGIECCEELAEPDKSSCICTKYQQKKWCPDESDKVNGGKCVDREEPCSCEELAEPDKSSCICTKEQNKQWCPEWGKCVDPGKPCSCEAFDGPAKAKCVCKNEKKKKWCPDDLDDVDGGTCVGLNKSCPCIPPSCACEEFPRYCIYSRFIIGGGSEHCCKADEYCEAPTTFPGYWVCNNN